MVNEAPVYLRRGAIPGGSLATWPSAIGRQHDRCFALRAPSTSYARSRACHDGAPRSRRLPPDRELTPAAGFLNGLRERLSARAALGGAGHRG